MPELVAAPVVPEGTYCIHLKSHQRPLFGHEQDYLQCLQMLEQQYTASATRTLGYCLLPTAIYWLVMIADQPPERIALQLRQAYSQYTNQKSNRHGSVFAEAMGIVMVEPASWLTQVVRQLHFLPVDERLVPTPDCYRWSSHHRYQQAASGNRQDWFDATPVLNRVGNQRSQQRRRYEEYMSLSTAPRCGAERLETGCHPVYRALASDSYLRKTQGRAGEHPPAARSDGTGQAPNT